MAGGFVVHGVLLHDDYMKLAGLFRSEADAQKNFVWMLLAHVICAGAFAWIYSRGAEAAPWLPQGLRFGVAVALLTIVPDVYDLLRRSADAGVDRDQADRIRRNCDSPSRPARCIHLSEFAHRKNLGCRSDGHGVEWRRGRATVDLVAQAAHLGRTRSRMQTGCVDHRARLKFISRTHAPWRRSGGDFAGGVTGSMARTLRKAPQQYTRRSPPDLTTGTRRG